MKNKEANLRLIKRINELDVGEYEVNTSKGKFKIEKNITVEELFICSSRYKVDEIHIIIRDNQGNPFSKYYSSHSWGPRCYTDEEERETDYSNEFNLKYGYSINYKTGVVTIYQNEDHSKFYNVWKDQITDEKTKVRARINNRMISNDFLLTIDLNSFDRIVEINNKNIIIPKDKNLEKELNKYNQEVVNLKEKIIDNEYLNKIIDNDLCTFRLCANAEISELKTKEQELLMLSKIYVEAMKIMNYTHDLSIMREIVSGLNPEFKKLLHFEELNNSYKYFDCKTRCTFKEKILKLKCGIYFIETSKGLIQIDRFSHDYSISDEEGNFIFEITDPILTNEIVMGIKDIVQKQEAEASREQVKQLNRELKTLEREN